MIESIHGLDMTLTETGLATEEGTFTIASEPHKYPTRIDRYLDIYSRIDAHRLRPPERTLVMLEGYSFHSKGRAVVSLGELGGVVRLRFQETGVLCVEVAPSSLKLFAAGKGGASKELVLGEVTKRSEIVFPNTHECEAWVLRQMALVHYGLRGAIGWPKTHLKALEKIEWPDV